jgi:YfiH family protein
MQTLTVVWPDLPAGVGMLSTLRSGGVSSGRYGAVGVNGPHDTREPHHSNAGTDGGRVDGSEGMTNGGLNLGLHVGDDPASVEKNRRLLRGQLPADPVWLTQVHGTRVLDLSSAFAPEPAHPLSHEADASIASEPEQVCAILTADCLPVLLADYRGTQVGAAHAGWRGLAQGVIEQTVAALRASGADQLTAWLGPAIGPQAFEVGSEVREAFAHLGPEAEAAFVPVPDKTGKFFADLAGLARIALLRSGVTQVSGGGDCTVSNPAKFYSFRRDQITGRMASMIWIK